MATLQRPTEASNALFWHPPGERIPVGSALVVGDQECVVASLNGATLGVIATGAHTLTPLSFAFLAPSIDASSTIGAELWFVRTSELHGIPIGGPLAAVRSDLEGLEVTPRLVGEYSLKVTDPVRFVQGIMTMAGPDAVLAAVSGVVLRKAKELYSRLVTELRSVLNSDVVRRLMVELPATLDELPSLGLSARLANATVSFSDDDRKALTAVNTQRATAARNAKIQEMQAAAKAPSAGQPTARAPSGQPVSPAVLPSPGGKGKGRLFAILGVVGVVVVAAVIAVVLHFTHGESHAASPAAAPQHEAKHGKH